MATAAMRTPAAASLLLHGAVAAALLLTLPGQRGIQAPTLMVMELALVAASPEGEAAPEPTQAEPTQAEAVAEPGAPESTTALDLPDTVAELPSPELPPLPEAPAALPLPEPGLPLPVSDAVAERPSEPAPGPPPRPAPQRAAAVPRPSPPRAAPTGGGAAAQPQAAPAAAPAAPATAPGPPPVITDARYRSPPAPPVYPPGAVSLGITGSVILRALVGPDGETHELRVWRSSGNPLLDNAALAAARRWAFAPARHGPHPIAAWVEVPVHFRLN
jgi:protein TonB